MGNNSIEEEKKINQFENFVILIITSHCELPTHAKGDEWVLRSFYKFFIAKGRGGFD